MKTVRNTYEVVRGITLSTKFVLDSGETARVRMQGHNGSQMKIKGTYVTSDPALIKQMDAANGNAANGGREFRLKLSEEISTEEVVKEESKREVDPVDPKVEQPVPEATTPEPQAAVAPVQTGKPEDLRTPRTTPDPVPEQPAPVVESKAEEVKEGSPADEVPEPAEEVPQGTPGAKNETPTQKPTEVPEVKQVQKAREYLKKNFGQALNSMPNKASVLKFAGEHGVAFPNLPK